VDDPAWSTSAAFLDFDRDGRLDLFVGNYVNFSLDNHKVCRRPDTAADYCGPQSFDPVADRLFRNTAGGIFQQVTSRNGLGAPGANLGTVVSDFDNDGWLDIFVANDAMENFLWMNQGDGTFNDAGLVRGVAVNARGEKEGSMGVGLGDYDNDGDLDLFLTHLGTETNTLYGNDGGGNFRDVTRQAGLAASSHRFTGFGTAWLDYDNDGWLDLLAVNGAVRIIAEQAAAGDPLPLKETDQLFRNLGNGRFEEMDVPVLKIPGASRAAAFGDIDNDGDTDVLITNNNGPARLLLNNTVGEHHWVGVRLLNEAGSDALGGQAVLTGEDGSQQMRVVISGGSYLSASDPRLLFGLGAHRSMEHVDVRWPDGNAERWNALEIDRYHVLIQGSGTPVEP